MYAGSLINICTCSRGLPYCSNAGGRVTSRAVWSLGSILGRRVFMSMLIHVARLLKTEDSVDMRASRQAPSVSRLELTPVYARRRAFGSAESRWPTNAQGISSGRSRGRGSLTYYLSPFSRPSLFRFRFGHRLFSSCLFLVGTMPSPRFQFLLRLV